MPGTRCRGPRAPTRELVGPRGRSLPPAQTPPPSSSPAAASRAGGLRKGSRAPPALPAAVPRPPHLLPAAGPTRPGSPHPHPGSPPEASPRSPVVTWSATAPPLHRMCVTSPSRPGSARKAAGIWKGECCCGGGREAPMVREGESWSTEVTMVGNRKNGDSEVGIHQRNTDPGILFCLMSERWSLKISAVLKRIPRKERDVGICFSGYWDDSCRG
ncbi:uncharacterized protein [Canis lupus baileyi]|uniref:uncharacterized protein n=1 Tax=Canis lupus baileyi TaxID=143281 RepID=UPI003B9790FC